MLKKKKMQSKCIVRVVDEDIGSPCKIIPDIFDFSFKRSCHGAFVTPYGLHLSAPPLLRAHMMS